MNPRGLWFDTAIRQNNPTESWWTDHDEFYRRARAEFPRMRFSREAHRPPTPEGRGLSSLELARARKRIDARAA
jgi:hypothetical protein